MVRDAPGDVREQRSADHIFVSAVVERGRAGLAEQLASVVLSALPLQTEVDAISVKLARSTGSTVEFSSVIHRDRGRRIVARIPTLVSPCALE